MPLVKLKKLWNYCTYNKEFFIFILILFAIINLFEDTYAYTFNYYISSLIFLAYIIVYNGYGMNIARDRANHGVRLPKILPKDIVVLGIKSTIVVSIYLFVQGEILDFVCSPLGFPPFDLEDMLFNFKSTLYLLYTHDPAYTIIFLVLGAISFYITLFFMEIALARLADTGEMLPSFNIIEIKKNIDIVGWRHYTVDCTSIIVAIVILGFFKAIVIPIPIIDYVVNVILALLIFVAQFLGIGAIYSEVKDKTSNNGYHS